MKILVLDESGAFNNPEAKERYFVLGGILYDFDDFNTIKEKLIPKMDLYRKLKDRAEIKTKYLTSNSNLNKMIYGSLLSDINNCTEITPIIYILDKKTSYIFDGYSDISFKYNKLIQFLIEDLKLNSFISDKENIRILMDEYAFDEYNMNNFIGWLPKNVSEVISVDMGESKNYNFIQVADILAGIPKLKGVTPKNILKDHKIALLGRSFIHMLPKSNSNEVLGSNGIK